MCHLWPTEEAYIAAMPKAKRVRYIILGGKKEAVRSKLPQNSYLQGWCGIVILRFTTGKRRLWLRCFPQPVKLQASPLLLSMVEQLHAASAPLTAKRTVDGLYLSSICYCCGGTVVGTRDGAEDDEKGHPEIDCFKARTRNEGHEFIPGDAR